MHKILLVFTLILLAFGCSRNEVKEVAEEPFNQWKEGSFYYQQDPFGTFLISRTDSNQIETITQYDLIVDFAIEWLTDTSYNLTFKQVLNNPESIALPQDIDSLVKTCYITQETDSSYVEEATSNLNDLKNYTTIQRVKKF